MAVLNAQLEALADKNQGLAEVAAAWNAASRKIIVHAQSVLAGNSN